MTIPALSVIIVNWNTRELTLSCLESIAGGIGEGLSWETIVVDNGSVDGSVAALRERDDVRLIENDGNVGFAAAVNQAYRQSTGELVLLLNSDVKLLPNSAAALVRLLGERPEVAGASPLYRNPDGSHQHFHFRIPTFATMLANGSAFVRLLPGMDRRLRAFRMLDDDFSAPRSVEQPSASCLLLRRSCLPPDQVLDERYPIFFNDVQLARSLARAGHELWVTPDAVVVHEGHASTLQLGAALKRQYVASLVRMLQETAPRRNVIVYQAIVVIQGIALLAVRHPNALSWTDLKRALAGDPGLLPARPISAGL